VVTATQTITNDDYRATADGNLSAVGEAPAVTYVGQLATKYYYFGSTRVAMRKGSELYYLHGDHLGSTSLTTDASGNIVAQSRYLPYGQERWTWGAAQTDFTFTGQRNDSFGLSDFNARYYDPYLNRFISPDSIVPEPGNPQTLNRYSYANANPVKFTDSSGHCVWDLCIGEGTIVLVAAAAIVMYDYAYVSGPNAAQNTRALATTVQKAGEALATTVSDVGEGIKEGFSPPPAVSGQPGGFTLEQQPYPLLTSPHYLDTPELKPTFPGAPLEQPEQGDLLETFPLVKPESQGPAVLTAEGRGGKQERLRQLGNDPKVSSALRGWIKQEENQIERGERSTIRVPPGMNLAHRRGFEAKNGYDYEYSDLQDTDLHRLQHKYEGY
jgi:RHS repeat-associated protein